jgi:hypothetical protein
VIVTIPDNISISKVNSLSVILHHAFGYWSFAASTVKVFYIA